MDRYKEIWFCDFEYSTAPDHRPQPLCFCAIEHHTGRSIQQWLTPGAECPIDLGNDSLYVAYYANAEMWCHNVLGWPYPANLYDVAIECACQTTNIVKDDHFSNGLYASMDMFGLPHWMESEKEYYRDLALGAQAGIIEGSRNDLMKYCLSDCECLRQLLPYVWDKRTLATALYHASYMRDIIAVQEYGVPIDVEFYTALKDNWPQIKQRSLESANDIFGLWDGGTLKKDKLTAMVESRGYTDWPRTPTGKAYATDRDTLKLVSDAHAELLPLYEVLQTHSLMKAFDVESPKTKTRRKRLALGPDNRNRCVLWPYSTITGRHAPSSTEYIFGAARWVRSMIKAPPGRCLLYIDYMSQEVGIAAALSGDTVMLDAYRHDPYLTLGKMAGTSPPDGTKLSHSDIRGRYKTVLLGMMYGLGLLAMSRRMGLPIEQVAYLRRDVYVQFHEFWRWLRESTSLAFYEGRIETNLGWRHTISDHSRRTSIQNWQMQATAAEIIRLAVQRLLAAGIQVDAEIHDAVLVECDMQDQQAILKQSQDIMGSASMEVLDGVLIPAECGQIIPEGDVFRDGRGFDYYLSIREMMRKMGVLS